MALSICSMPKISNNSTKKNQFTQNFQKDRVLTLLLKSNFLQTVQGWFSVHTGIITWRFLKLKIRSSGKVKSFIVA